MENQSLFNEIWQKSNLKQDIYKISFDAFQLFKIAAQQITNEFADYTDQHKGRKIPFEYNDRGDLEFEITFGGDVLLFLMHSNIFELPRNHEVMSTRYIKEDKQRSYCGMIHIYNFLADSFKYGRENDAGYLIGRVLINKENHYVIEGKKEIGTIYHQYSQSVLNNEAIERIIQTSLEYTLNFDLLVPPYEKVAYISVMDVVKAASWKRLGTEKRLGFKFQADKKEVRDEANY
jgi:hypothetical protein